MNALRRKIAAQLGKRFVAYGSVGTSTFLLDLSILTLLLTYTDLSFSISLAIGFGIGVTVNFLVQYFVVYAGTPQRFITGYGIFVSLAIANLFMMVHGAWFLYETVGIPFLAARLVVGSVTGSINFLLNTFFNFKLL